MGDKPGSDDEINNSANSSTTGGKKLKLNDGSSQESVNDAASSTKTESNEENVDSGVCVEKSESTSSEGPVPGTSTGPTNEVVNLAPSSHFSPSFIIRLRRPNYRKRKTPDRDSNSSMDSDDLSVFEPQEDQPMAPEAFEINNSETESDIMDPDNSPSVDRNDLMDLVRGFTGSDSNESLDSSSGAISNSSYDSNSVQMDDGITDSDDESIWAGSRDENEDSAPPTVLLKTRPKHNYIIVREIINRELGLTFPPHKTKKDDVIFEQNFYGSLHAVYRLKKLHHLNKHRGCVNSINFHPDGNLLVSGSDDRNVIIWDWAKNIAKQTIKTGHKANVFQTKFLYLNHRSQLNIVTCARDGAVFHVQCPASGGRALPRLVARHAGAAHKLHVSPLAPASVLSCGEDAKVAHIDLRDPHEANSFVVRHSGVAVPLYSVAGSPRDWRRVALAGRDKFVREYDARHTRKPLALYCPHQFDKNHDKMMMHLTCAVYNHDGTEILGSYNDDDIYLFNTKTDVYDKDNINEEKDGYTHRYTGHRNSATYKGVAFFGPKSQYIVSGSDCSHIYIWEKNSEAIVQWMQGDKGGVVNCIESHPRVPILATSGLDRDVKLWAPHRDSDPDYKGLEQVVRKNKMNHLRGPLFNDFLPFLYSAWRDEQRPAPGADIEFHGNVCTAM